MSARREAARGAGAIRTAPSVIGVTPVGRAGPVGRRPVPSAAAALAPLARQSAVERRLRSSSPLRHGIAVHHPPIRPTGPAGPATIVEERP